MSAFGHALLYTILVSTGIISGFFSLTSEKGKETKQFEELEIIENAYETESLEEKVNIPLETEYAIYTDKVKVYKSSEGIVESLSLEDYVAGVLLAEMPSWYGEEALKAAAVAVRTYTLYKMNSSKHDSGADICDNPSHCQAFYELEYAVQAWSENRAQTAFEKIKSAVSATSGKILVYDGKPILAVYHASSYLNTRSSSEVFGGETAYLQSVSVPFENKENTRFSEKSFSKQEVLSVLANEVGFKKADSYTAIWEKNKCKGIQVTYGTEKKLITSSRVRALFSLASGNFEIEEKGDETVFCVYGFGHGVGLSQQGAGILADRGWKWEEIVLHYYKNVKTANLKIYE